jgi:hypothetical protein
MLHHQLVDKQSYHVNTEYHAHIFPNACDTVYWKIYLAVNVLNIRVLPACVNQHTTCLPICQRELNDQQQDPSVVCLCTNGNLYLHHQRIYSSFHIARYSIRHFPNKLTMRDTNS